MPRTPLPIGGRLAVNFVNSISPSLALSWPELIDFLQSAAVISSDRGAQLLQLPHSDPQAADALLSRADCLRHALREIFTAMVRREKISSYGVALINSVLQITEGHDELTSENDSWRLEFIAREGGLDWLLAAIARSAAEIVMEGPRARMRKCSNPSCNFFFCDRSRTGRRRWCSMSTCGNRSKVAAFARRHASRSGAN